CSRRWRSRRPTWCSCSPRPIRVTSRPRCFHACSASTSGPSRRRRWRPRSKTSSARKTSPSIRRLCPRSSAPPRDRCATRSRCSIPRSRTATDDSRPSPPQPRAGPERGGPVPARTAAADVRAFAAALLARETAPALEAIDRAARDGEDLGAFTRDVVELLRRVLVIKAAPTVKLADVSHAEGNELRRLAEPASLDELLYVLRAFLDADEAMREPPHPRVELEMATVRTTRRPAPPAIEDILKRVDDAAQRLRQGGGATSPVTPAAQATLLGDEPRPATVRP